MCACGAVVPSESKSGTGIVGQKQANKEAKAAMYSFPNLDKEDTSIGDGRETIRHAESSHLVSSRRQLDERSSSNEMLGSRQRPGEEAREVPLYFKFENDDEGKDSNDAIDCATNEVFTHASSAGRARSAQEEREISSFLDADDDDDESEMNVFFEPTTTSPPTPLETMKRLALHRRTSIEQLLITSFLDGDDEEECSDFDAVKAPVLHAPRRYTSFISADSEASGCLKLDRRSHADKILIAKFLDGDEEDDDDFEGKFSV